MKIIGIQQHVNQVILQNSKFQVVKPIVLAPETGSFAT